MPGKPIYFAKGITTVLQKIYYKIEAENILTIAELNYLKKSIVDLEQLEKESDNGNKNS